MTREGDKQPVTKGEMKSLEESINADIGEVKKQFKYLDSRVDSLFADNSKQERALKELKSQMVGFKGEIKAELNELTDLFKSFMVNQSQEGAAKVKTQHVGGVKNETKTSAASAAGASGSIAGASASANAINRDEASSQMEAYGFTATETDLLRNIIKTFPIIWAAHHRDQEADNRQFNNRVLKYDDRLVVSGLFDSSGLITKLSKLVTLLEINGINFENWTISVGNHLSSQIRAKLVKSGATTIDSARIRWCYLLIILFGSFSFDDYHNQMFNSIVNQGIAKNTPIKEAVEGLIIKSQNSGSLDTFPVVKSKITNWISSAIPTQSTRDIKALHHATSFDELSTFIDSIDDFVVAGRDECHHHTQGWMSNNPRFSTGVDNKNCFCSKDSTAAPTKNEDYEEGDFNSFTKPHGKPRSTRPAISEEDAKRTIVIYRCKSCQHSNGYLAPFDQLNCTKCGILIKKKQNKSGRGQFNVVNYESQDSNESNSDDELFDAPELGEPVSDNDDYSKVEGAELIDQMKVSQLRH